MSIYACPNPGLGAADVKVGQPWRHYQTDPRFTGIYEVAEIDGTDVSLALLHGFDHGHNARHWVTVDVGYLLAHWQYEGATA